MERAEDRAEPGLRDRFRAWLRLRQDSRVGESLRYGDVRIIETGSAEVFAFARSLNGQRVVCVANRGSEEFDAARVVESARGNAKSPPRRVDGAVHGGAVGGRDTESGGAGRGAAGSSAMRIGARSAGVFEINAR